MSESDNETTVATHMVAEPPSFSSLPDEIVVNCLARISTSYYPKLSVVSKTFRSLISSNELYVARCQLKTTEDFFHVCLQLFSCHRPTWFALRIKPDRTLTNDLEKKYASIGNTLLVPTPSDSLDAPFSLVSTASEDYVIEQNHSPSCAMWVRKKGVLFWREAPRMTVARASAFAAVLDGKIYVMGGCEEDETANWAEVFDTRTQNWESLPDPGPELRFSEIKKTEGVVGKLYVMTNIYGKDYVYDPKEGKWDTVAKGMVACIVENVRYCCDRLSFFWCDTKRKEWRLVRGLATLGNRFLCGVIEIATYNGKLLVLWDEFRPFGRDSFPCQHKNIWCAVIAFERRNDDEVWGNIEWANLVLTVPSSYVFLRSWLVNSH